MTTRTTTRLKTYDNHKDYDDYNDHKQHDSHYDQEQHKDNEYHNLNDLNHFKLSWLREVGFSKESCRSWELWWELWWGEVVLVVRIVLVLKVHLRH